MNTICSLKGQKLRKNIVKKRINFPTDFSLAHCGKEISLKDPTLRLAGWFMREYRKQHIHGDFWLKGCKSH